MYIELYSEKTFAQCMSELNERLHAKGTSTRPEMDGWIDKSGNFLLSISRPVVLNIHRRTKVRGKVERKNNQTIIRADVPSGVNPQGQVVVYLAFAVIIFMLLANGNSVAALLPVPFALYLYIPMRGDFLNKDILVNDLQKTLKAKTTPIKKDPVPK